MPDLRQNPPKSGSPTIRDQRRPQQVSTSRPGLPVVGQRVVRRHQGLQAMLDLVD